MLASCSRSIPITSFVVNIASKKVLSPNFALKSYQTGIRGYARVKPSGGFGSRMGTVGVGGAAKKTLRERLLGPTTGTPFVIGMGVVSGASALGIGALCYYGLGLSNQIGAVDRARLWPQFVKDRIRHTYGYLAGGLAFTAGSAIAVSRSPQMLQLMSKNSMLMMFGSLAAIVATGSICRSIEYKPGQPGIKQAAWMLHCATLGAVLAPLCMLGGPLLVRAAWYTGGVVGGLSSVAACAPSDKFLTWGGPLAMGLGVVFVSSLGTMFLPPTTALGAGLYSVAMYGGLVVFGGFLLYDTQRVIKMAEHYPTYGVQQAFDPINAQLGIYLDTLNIFIRIAMIMAGGGNRRK